MRSDYSRRHSRSRGGISRSRARVMKQTIVTQAGGTIGCRQKDWSATIRQRDDDRDGHDRLANPALAHDHDPPKHGDSRCSVTQNQNARCLANLVLPASSRPRRARLPDRAQGRGRRRDGRRRWQRRDRAAAATSVRCRPRMRLPHVSNVILPSAHLFEELTSHTKSSTHRAKQVQCLTGFKLDCLDRLRAPRKICSSSAENPAMVCGLFCSPCGYSPLTMS
jgi:hypothetical protein